MQLATEYDVAIIGGGLAGLSCAIEMSKAGHSVVLFEKEKYPFHKVCGEYVSLESWNFLQQLGIPLKDMALPVIDTLFLSAPNGNSFTTKLPLGGFGISRHLLDHSLSVLAKKNGVHVVEEAKVNEAFFDEGFSVSFNSNYTASQKVFAKVCCAAYGKRSNLDIKWKRSFLNHIDTRLDNYVGVKYHVKTAWKENMIGLHNFKNGYCGISKIEADRYCLCYMTQSRNLRKCENDIGQMEKTILMQNPHLRKLFLDSTVLEAFPVTISQINFHRKNQVENHILMLGDAAGMITPLCGNGMSIALHTGKVSAKVASVFLRGKISRLQMEEQYRNEWRSLFERRLRMGRVLQNFFGSTKLSNSFVRLFKTFPFLAAPVIRMTHGKPF